MKKILKRTLITIGIVMGSLVLFTGILLLIGLAGLEETKSLDIQSVDLSRIPDGTYTGSYSCYRWSTTVKVTVEDHKITEILPVKTQDGRETLVEDLIEEVIEEQDVDVDVISGATASKNAFLKALEISLTEGVSDDPS